MQPLKISEVKSGKISDEQIVQRILNGEKEWYEILIKRYNQLLYRTIRSYLKDEVEDVMQNAYLKADENIGQFNGNASFGTWLIRIGINEALQFIRKKKKYRIINLNQKQSDSIKLLNIPDLNKMNPEKQFINKEGRLLFEKAIDQLPEKYRIVYVLREIEDMKNAEISACLNLSESNVKVRFYRAKQLMKETLYQFSAGANIFEFGNKRCDEMVNKVMERIR